MVQIPKIGWWCFLVAFLSFLVAFFKLSLAFSIAFPFALFALVAFHSGSPPCNLSFKMRTIQSNVVH